MYRLVSALTAALLLVSCFPGQQTRIENVSPTPLGQPSITLPAATSAAPSPTTLAAASPSATASPSAAASPSATAKEAATPSPTQRQTAQPTTEPTAAPTQAPTAAPTQQPTPTPTPTRTGNVAIAPAPPATTLGVYGKVTDSATGGPLSNVCITVGVPGAMCWGRTDINGNFAIDMVNPWSASPGQFELYFILSGYATDHSPKQVISSVVRIDYAMHH